MRVSETLSSEARPLGDCIWEIPTRAKEGMLVPARIYASEALLGQMDQGLRAGDECRMSPGYRPRVLVHA
jgi:hypothetical protein